MTCQLCTDNEARYRVGFVYIDGLQLCFTHARHYIHQKEFPSTSTHRKDFDEILHRMNPEKLVSKSVS